MDTTTDPVPQAGEVEVDQQAEAFICKLQLAHELSVVYWCNRCQNLHLYDEFTLYRQVHSAPYLA